ncbi:hypothetical protein C5975_19390 [Cronobacter sakazakii]|nr:hypothetical protein C5975_19390 [Cronobacter sakazakii]PQY60372.1 hypothetical protein C5954_02465 [Cronobacter sakazakii]
MPEWENLFSLPIYENIFQQAQLVSYMTVSGRVSIVMLRHTAIIIVQHWFRWLMKWHLMVSVIH